MLLLFLITGASLAVAWPDGEKPNCVSQHNAAEIVNTFTHALLTPKDGFENYISLIESIANPDYQEISDSVNFFTGAPVGSVTVSSFENLVSSHSSQGGPAYFEVETLNIWHSCNVITWRYRAITTEGAIPVQSIMALSLGNNGKIDTVFFEFNNAISAQNSGYTITAPTASA